MTAVIPAGRTIVHPQGVRVPSGTRCGLLFILAISVFAAPLVRAEHVHPAGIEGRARALVHAHQTQPQAPGEHRAHAAHGNHSLAIFLTTVYESVCKNPPAPPQAILPGAQPPADPRRDVLGSVDTHGLIQSPGPPATSASGRAPPRR